MTGVALVAALVAAILFAARLGLLIALHVVDKQYHPVRHAVSDYAVGPTRGLSSVMTWSTAVAWIALIVVVAAGLTDWHARIGVLIQLVILAVAFIALPYVPTDLEGQRRTVRGMLHYVLAIAWFALTYTLSGTFADLIGDRGGSLAGLLQVLHWVILISLIGVIASMILPKLRTVFGLVERVFIVAVSLFYLLTAVALMML